MKIQTKRDIQQIIRKCNKKMTYVPLKYNLIKNGSYDTNPPLPLPNTHTHLIEPRKPLRRFDQRRLHWLAMCS